MIEFPVFSQQSLIVKSWTQLNLADFNRSSFILSKKLYLMVLCVRPMSSPVKHSEANETFYRCSLCLPAGQGHTKVNNPAEYTFQHPET